MGWNVARKLSQGERLQLVVAAQVTTIRADQFREMAARNALAAALEEDGFDRSRPISEWVGTDGATIERVVQAVLDGVIGLGSNSDAE